MAIAPPATAPKLLLTESITACTQPYVREQMSSTKWSTWCSADISLKPRLLCMGREKEHGTAFSAQDLEFLGIWNSQDFGFLGIQDLKMAANNHTLCG